MNKYDIEIKEDDSVYSYKNVSLQDIEQILKEHPNYSELNAKQEKENEDNE